MSGSVVLVLQNCLEAFDVGLTCLASICSSFWNYIWQTGNVEKLMLTPDSMICSLVKFSMNTLSKLWQKQYCNNKKNVRQSDSTVAISLSAKLPGRIIQNRKWITGAHLWICLIMIDLQLHFNNLIKNCNHDSPG